MISPDDLEQVCDLLDLRDHDKIQDSAVVTDIVLLVRTRYMDDMTTSGFQIISSQCTDYITQLGMCRWAELITERGDE